MIEAFRLAEQISRYPRLSCLLICAPGIERIELSLAIAGDRQLVTLPSNAVGKDLSAEVLRAFEFDVVNTRWPRKPPVLYVGDACALPVAQQHFLRQLAFRASIIVAVDFDDLPALHRGLHDAVVGNAIHIPRLHKRKGDLVQVVCSWVGGLRPTISVEKVSQEVWDVLQNKPWQDTDALCAAVESACLIATEEGSTVLELRHLPPEVITASPHGWLDIPLSKEWTLQKLTDAYVLHARARLQSMTKAHRRLGMSKSGYSKRLARLTGKGQDPDRRYRGTPKERPPPELVTNPAHRWANCGKERQPDKGVSKPFGSRRSGG